MELRGNKYSHLEKLSKLKKAFSYECRECVKSGDTWVHLRTCQECGITLCCDSSSNQHARKHSIWHNHMVISSAEPREKWL